MAPYTKKRQPLPKEVVKQKLNERKKQSKQLLKKKRARLIVKNLPFKASEEDLKEYFGKYGEIENVELLRKSNGKLVGCGFIQYTLVQKAAKAKHHTNNKEFMGRQLVVSFAKSKTKYNKEKNHISEPTIETQDEVKKEEEISIKIEPDSDKEDEVTEIKESDTNEDNSETEIDQSDELSENGDNSQTDKNVNGDDKQLKRISNDVTEGKTVFVKNVPFDATNEDLKQCMLQFGPVYYALICMDRLTEHSKGTAFVKFVNKEDADKALNSGTELKLLGNVLDCHPALQREEVQKKAHEKKDANKGSKDSRNLYLVKEGVILAGSKAAHGVSAADMAKRLQIEQYKTQVLRNLNMFVSRERLVVYNLPPAWDDKKLRMLFQKHGGEGCVVREARVMRDMRNLDANGVGKSKEYGFVAFTKHEHALKALRSLNNNPNIFSPQKRPIISFSIENKVMIKAREKRLEKSRLNNPTRKDFKENSKQLKNKKDKQKTKIKPEIVRNEEELPNYSGVPTEPGKIEKMRSRYKLAAQAKLHHENIKKAKRVKKNEKKTLADKKKDFTKQPKQKINKKNEQDNFSKLVNEYKKKILSAPVQKTKWYQ